MPGMHVACELNFVKKKKKKKKKKMVILATTLN